MPEAEQIIEATDGYQRQFIGLVVEFDLHRKTAQGERIERAKGEVTAQRWLGLTERGRIPEYELTILGGSGKQVFARLTRDHVSLL